MPVLAQAVAVRMGTRVGAYILDCLPEQSCQSLSQELPRVSGGDMCHEAVYRALRVPGGLRLRREVRRLAGWARRHVRLHVGTPAGGFHEPCPCGHRTRWRPGTRDMAFALVHHKHAIDHLLRVVERDPAKWVGVLQCGRCGSYWAEDSLTSGQMDLFYCYPIHTDDPHAWLAAAEPLTLGTDGP